MKKETKNNLMFIFSVVGALGLGLFWGDIFRDNTSIEKYAIKQSITEDEKEKNLDKIEYLFDYVSQHHINANELDEQEMWENAFEGLLKGVDNGYTKYYPAIKESKVEKDIQGSYNGVGVSVNKSSSGTAYIENIDENSKANDIGLANGDKILTINDTDVSNSSSKEIDKILNNEEVINITVQRGDEVITKELKKEKVEPISYVHYQNIKGKNYIKIDSFNQKAYEDFAKILKEEVKNNDYLIIDLRDNYGGTLDSYEQMMDLLVGKNELLFSKKTIEGEEKIHSKSKRQYSFKHFSVIVNNQTASASELFASNIKDLLNGKIIGTNTYGKGSIQSVINLPDGSYLYITDKEYLTSKGEKVNGIGIKPDVFEDDYTKQLTKALNL